VSSSKPSTTIELPDALRKEIQDTLTPLVATWSGKAVDPTYVYGIRVYKDKAVLKPHRDRIETHIFGVIINVDQDVREDWPLMIEDHTYEPHQILMTPCEMVFYESARLKHGRPTPLEGNAFANVFCHFTPSDYKSPSIRYDTPKPTDED
jgi:prolyl 4-hydroxylase